MIKGLLVRFVIALVISWAGWLLLVTPFDRLPLSRDQVAVIARVLNFPAAVAGELTYPLRGDWLLVSDRGTWCDFCTYEQHLQYHLEVAIPAYLFLLYLPSWLRRLRGNRRLIRRIIAGLVVYGGFATPYLMTFGDVPYVAKWLLILASAATITWSNASIEWRSAGVIAVILDGAWAMSQLEMYQSFKIESALPMYPIHLGMVFIGVTTFLWLVWGFERIAMRGADRDPGPRLQAGA